MKQLFKIDESEKRRIIEMHENATKRNYLSEQGNAQPTQQPQQREPFTSASGVKYKLPLIKDAANPEDQLNKFVNINGGTVDASYLASLGIKGLGDAKVDMESGKGNFTTVVFRLLRSYVDAAAQLVGKNEILCGGFKNVTALDAAANPKNEDYSATFSNLGGGNIQQGKNIFYNAVTKALQTQINSLGGCQS